MHCSFSFDLIALLCRLRFRTTVIFYYEHTLTKELLIHISLELHLVIS